MIVKQFGINPGSGGEGCFKGGDGVIRELLFRKKQVLSILTERRTLKPYGLKGNHMLIQFLFSFCFILKAMCEYIYRVNADVSSLLFYCARV